MDFLYPHWGKEMLDYIGVRLVVVAALIVITVHSHAEQSTNIPAILPQTVSTPLQQPQAKEDLTNDKILTITQNQLAFIGTISTILSVGITIVLVVGFISPFFIYYQLSNQLSEKLEEELNRVLEPRIQQYENEARERIDQQSRHHEELVLAVEKFSLQLWETHCDKILEQTSIRASTSKSNKIFIEQIHEYLHDSTILRQLLLNEQSEVADALGKLESKANILPDTKMLVALLDLLERQGRLNAQLCQEPAKKLREKLAGNSEQTS